jgi:hypothetical protein
LLEIIVTKAMNKAKPRHHLNAPGDFYVERDMCIICRAPEHAAPDLMGFVDDPTGQSAHCFFKRQPTTEAETGRAVEAIRVSCCGALRYGGADPAIISALVKDGHRDACDQGPGPFG